MWTFVQNMRRREIAFHDYQKTITDKKALRYYLQSLEEITSRSKQIYRANHGGGMPCPEQICSSYTIFDNL
jgi:hypothetical protein